MTKEVLINVGAGEIRVAIVHDHRLDELFAEPMIGLDDTPQKKRGSGHHGHSLIGNILLGRVQRVLPGMQAAFVEIGLERAGFLAAREARCLADPLAFDEAHPPKISDCVREGQEILVQVIKDPIGEKGARLSANVTLPGRLLVMVPHSPGVALSRRIDDEAERARLLATATAMIAEAGPRIPPNAGFILRSAAVGAALQDLMEDAERLTEVWRPVLERRRLAKPPVTLYHDLHPIERTMRDEVDGETIRVLIDDAASAEAARAYCRRAMPQAEAKIEWWRGPEILFDLYGIEDEIEALLRPRVALPAGGWITIETTEALTAIDVNSGSYTAASGLEETSLVVNLQAAEEIGRQLRLRGIGGLIVIDFIHLDEAANVERVLGVLAASLAKDRTPTQISAMSQFGLVEITRKRIRDPLSKRMTEGCRACRGGGRVVRVESVALEIVRRIERSAAAAPGKAITVRAAPEVVRWLLVHEDELMAGLARRGVGRVQFEPRSEFAREGFDVST